MPLDPLFSSDVEKRHVNGGGVSLHEISSRDVVYTVCVCVCVCVIHAVISSPCFALVKKWPILDLGYEFTQAPNSLD
jgi:hypothetical protein